MTSAPRKEGSYEISIALGKPLNALLCRKILNQFDHLIYYLKSFEIIKMS